MEDKELKNKVKELAQFVSNSDELKDLEKVELCKSRTIPTRDTLDNGHGRVIGKYCKYSKDIELCIIMFAKGNKLYLWHGVRGVEGVMKPLVSQIGSDKEIKTIEPDGYFLQNSPSLEQSLDKLLCEKDKDNGRSKASNVLWYVGIYTRLDFNAPLQVVEKTIALYTSILD